jgi:hypothetical protein
MRTLRAALASTTPPRSTPRLYEFSRSDDTAELTLGAADPRCLPEEGSSRGINGVGARL